MLSKGSLMMNNKKGLSLMAFIQIPLDIITATNITNAEKIVVAALLNFRWKDTNITYIGNYKLAEFLHTSRQAIIRALKNLEEKQYVIINPRKNCSQSNEIVLTIERGIEFALEGVQKPLEGYQIDTPKGNQNDTPEGYQNDTPETQIGTPGYQNDTPHKDIIFKYPDLNLKTREEGNQNDTPRAHSNYIAPADVAAGLSKPSQQAGENSAGNVGADVWAAKDKRMRKLLMRIYPDFTTWYALFRTPAGTYQINPVSSLIERIMPDKARINSVPDGVEVCSWAETPRLGLIKIM